MGRSFKGFDFSCENWRASMIELGAAKRLLRE
jgi:hypothetical protein